jgi:hypothetical protein
MNTKPISKTNLITKTISGILALILAACSLAPAETTATIETQPSLVPNTPTYTATASQTPTVEPTATIEPSPTLVPTKSPEQVLAEFKESTEYKQGLQDYLDAMGLEEENVVITQEQRSINGVDYLFVNATPDKTILKEIQIKREVVYGTVPIFVAIKNLEGNWEFPILERNKEYVYVMKHPIVRLISDAAGIPVGTNIEQWTGPYLNQFNIGYLHLDWSYQYEERDNNYRINNLAPQANINQFIMGHIIMPPQFPSEIASLSSSNRLAAIEQRAFDAVSKYDFNKLRYLTVVNEPHQIAGGSPISKEEILAAFRAAKKSNPSAKLMFSETDNHYLRGPFTQLTNDMVELLKKEDLVDAVAAQAHVLQFPFHADKLPTSEDIATTLKSYGLPVVVTEFDINQTHMGMMGIPKEERDLEQALIAYDTITGFIDSGVVEAILFWGIEDVDHWLSHEKWDSFSISGGSLEARATIFNNGKPKPFFYAFLKVLYDNLPNQ